MRDALVNEAGELRANRGVGALSRVGLSRAIGGEEGLITVFTDGALGIASVDEGALALGAVIGR